MLTCSKVASWGPISSSWFYSIDYYPTVWHNGSCWFWRQSVKLSFFFFLFIFPCILLLSLGRYLLGLYITGTECVLNSTKTHGPSCSDGSVQVMGHYPWIVEDSLREIYFKLWPQPKFISDLGFYILLFSLCVFGFCAHSWWAAF